MRRAALRCTDSSDDLIVPGYESQAADAYSISGRKSCSYAVTLIISELVIITLRLTKPRAAFACLLFIVFNGCTARGLACITSHIEHSLNAFLFPSI